MASVPSSWTLGLEGCERLLCGMRAVEEEEDVEMLTQPHRRRQSGRGWGIKERRKGVRRASGWRKAGREQVCVTVLRGKETGSPRGLGEQQQQQRVQGQPGRGGGEHWQGFRVPQPSGRQRSLERHLCLVTVLSLSPAPASLGTRSRETPLCSCWTFLRHPGVHRIQPPGSLQSLSQRPCH